MRRLLIVGCGDVVRRALPRLRGQWRLYALVREWDPALAAQGVTQLQGDLDRPATLRRLAGLADAVLHSAPPSATGAASAGDPRTRRLIAALRRGRSLPRRLVYISTSGVYGDCRGAWVAETRPLAAAGAASARGQRRQAAERLLRGFGRDSGCAVSLLRAPGIYAADRLPTERLGGRLPLLRPEDDVHTNHIHAEDLARACLAALRRGRPGRAYNVTDDSELAMGEWYDRLCDAFGQPRLPRVSWAEAQARLPAVQLSFMAESRRLDNRRMKRELGLRLAYPTVEAGLAEITTKENR
ncbi:NAD(P)-dependent oxidoreductase [Denitratisoma sp. DHT3]|uniref:NAD-dependent epimerase/dehydratase family protein n=1 Tax=Denitratisoma sp. DHT3 TaxID=1981880 RepID=UPI001198985F|nr:NAD-dependent epimerase/dehydratase family protein [Denitratisoma sp. DHT3]QDX81868.1 NAD(P)-dependent oxidoreductase [Denitratisoma sp. DHT3]